MRILIQRVTKASVVADGELSGEIGPGLLVFVGIEEEDTEEDIEWLSNKICNLRIFNDNEGKMNFSVQDIDGGILCISQFTLHASTKKGKRPSYIRAARPEVAIPLYEKFLQRLKLDASRPIEKGRFGTNMEVSLVNDGPVTIWMDSKNRE